MENTLILAMLCALLSACGQKGALYLPNTPTPTKLNSNIIDESTLDAVINSPSNG
ncbi:MULTISPECIES: LPS translocon maturation chaperone LptM [unclassified Moraxella]|uniref:LPS translocon maturation chaperone LptM n=1 Tax=unclassified Moraxella TaxID=2685852 RepID=UPI002B40EA0C|nr:MULTISPECIES: lipoprotein [unclassified Moraxella]